MMQYRGNYTKVKSVPPQTLSLWGENVGKIYSTWILGIQQYNIYALGATLWTYN